MKKLVLLLLFVGLIQSIPALALDYTKKSDQEDYIWAGKKFINERVKDSSSSKFRNVFFNLANAGGKSYPAVCGEINSKNSYGAMTGFQRFVSVPPAISALEEETTDFNNIWKMMCQ